MTKIINLCYISGNIFKIISYSDIDNLRYTLQDLLKEYDKDTYIQLILNNVFINISNETNYFNFYRVNNLKYINEEDIIQVVFVSKILLFVENINDKYILNNKYFNDNFYVLLSYYIDNNINYDFINLEYRNFVFTIIKTNGDYLKYASHEIKNDKEIVLCAVNHKYRKALKYASHDMKNDKDVVLLSVTINPDTLKYASYDMKDDKDVVLLSVTINPDILEYATMNMKNNKDVVLAAVKQNGFSVMFAGEKMLDDKDVILAAININGSLLEYASNNIKNNKDIVLLAVDDFGLALKYASTELKSDIDIILTAASNDFKYLQYADEKLISNEYVQKAISDKNLVDLEFYLRQIKKIENKYNY